ncbi:HGxxPAAW family protein [Streptomyces zingiberis]|uniref:Cytochrome c oxidase polypeptide IV n=1 Tax=Streptomyces zingiberis TaxID=2053010 RepID=A0ABX1C1A9_9ACTN|nr:HGxxPAAW family protein [Streptomyces zingiberis]NJQ02450.1 hypothetical protein [Streptomyces zingiberis]
MAGHDHGHTPAAWTGSIIAFIGFCVASAFTVLAQPIGFWAGVVVIFLGGIVGWVMKKAGMGRDETLPRQPGERQPQS